MIAKPTFADLKSHYKVFSTDVHTCTMSFPNTCAIRMSEALVAARVEFLKVFKNSGKNVCPCGYVRGAQDLGAILGSQSGFGTKTYGWSGNEKGTPPDQVQGKKGIVCYMNIPGFSGQGHIDLRECSAAVGSAYWDAETIWMWSLP